MKGESTHVFWEGGSQRMVMPMGHQSQNQIHRPMRSLSTPVLLQDSDPPEMLNCTITNILYVTQNGKATLPTPGAW